MIKNDAAAPQFGAATGGAHHSVFKLLIMHLDGLPFILIMLMYNMFLQMCLFGYSTTLLAGY